MSKVSLVFMDAKTPDGQDGVSVHGELGDATSQDKPITQAEHLLEETYELVDFALKHGISLRLITHTLRNSPVANNPIKAIDAIAADTSSKIKH